ncbi:NAD(P)/FAD-dependent oxidoreductase [Desulfovibrio inopinatus]|uniref:NAD(P)/FAD-dependent oxidoreductase n=1 Tax=Desulfovibrio inopinatus TaxID=102109 RepID=UPI0004215345|nr:FAD-dependent oxidoreductase [Desulfovibrio inopinatus]
MAKHLVLVGAGHAHLTTLAGLTETCALGARVTVIGPGTYHYYSGMGPGALGGYYTPAEIRFNVERLTRNQGGTFLKDRVVSFDPQAKILSTEHHGTIDYDIVSFNVGSRVPNPLSGPTGQNVYPVKPIENLLAAARHIAGLVEQGHPPRVLVIGGGPAGFEVAGNVRHLIRSLGEEMPDVTLVAGRQLLPSFPERVCTLAAANLFKRNITLLQGVRAVQLTEDELVLSDERRLPYDVVFLAMGVAPPALFTNAGVADSSGALPVNKFLQHPEYPDIFGGGDCISFLPNPLAKVGVYPVRENPILKHNLDASVAGEPLMPFTDTDPNFLLILNCGDGTGIFRKKNFIFSGRIAFFIKDFIDKRFMRKFQVSGERED